MQPTSLPFCVRALGIFAVLFASACVSPPLNEGLTADERLAAILDGDLSPLPRGMDRDLRALSLDYPRHVPTLLADAAVSLETGRVDRATSLLDTVLRIEPDNVEAVLMATQIATYRGDLAGAHRRIRTALQQRPDEPLLYESQAATFFVEERFGESLEALAKADALAGTTSWRSHYHRGLVAESQGNAVSAIEHFDHCLDLAPNYEPAARRLRALEASLPTQP